jgi:hypothetical protein
MSLGTAGLLLRSLQQAYRIDPGFETSRLGIALVSPGQAGYDRARSEQFFGDIRRRLAAVAGVESVSWATQLPADRSGQLFDRRRRARVCRVGGLPAASLSRQPRGPDLGAARAVIRTRSGQGHSEQALPTGIPECRQRGLPAGFGLGQ